MSGGRIVPIRTVCRYRVILMEVFPRQLTRSFAVSCSKDLAQLCTKVRKAKVFLSLPSFQGEENCGGPTATLTTCPLPSPPFPSYIHCTYVMYCIRRKAGLFFASDVAVLGWSREPLWRRLTFSICLNGKIRRQP